MAKPRFLTKSRFKTGHECPTKLYFADNREYANDKLDDKFLKALAEGGFQVGELAKLYKADGIEVEERDHHKAWEITQEHLKRENVVLFEAALMYENLFVRVDVLVKKGNAIRLIEVKAKSWSNEKSFTTKKGGISSDWEPYIADIAFQRYVAMSARPQFRYTAYLCMVDKDKTASVDGLHQRFFLVKNDDRTGVEVVPGTTQKDLGEVILREVNVDNEIEIFVAQDFEGKSFDEYVSHLSQLAHEQKLAPPNLTRACGGCEFRVAEKDLNGKKSGFVQCWSSATKLKPSEFSKPMIFDIWNLHYAKKDRLIKDQRYFVKDVAKEDIEPEEDDSNELSAKQRQWLQVEYTQNGKTEPYFDVDHFNYRADKEKWKAPFHFIDFETTTSAIPFHKGMRPYETIAFQFSHHVIDANGQLRHQTEYLSTKPGEFPNFDFVRKLKAALEKDSGTVFRYAAHENTVLNHIRTQLLNSNEKDRAELVAFIESITVRKENNKIVHEGPRAMVDMLELVKKLYYSPLMGGSNSIKKVLPAAMQESKFLREKYGRPVYGANGEGGIFSHNFKQRTWIKMVDGRIEDPYHSLEPVFKDVDPATWEKFERIFADDEIQEGGAASTAYARMQFTRMSDPEREAVAKSLLQYCELDTLAMVMIWEYWTQELAKKAKKAA